MFGSAWGTQKETYLAMATVRRNGEKGKVHIMVRLKCLEHYEQNTDHQGVVSKPLASSTTDFATHMLLGKMKRSTRP